MSEQKYRAFVTGAAGFLGRNLIQELLMENWDVMGLVRNPRDEEELRKLNVTPIRGSLNDPEALKKLIPVGIDAIFHLASLVTYWRAVKDQQYKTNVIGTRDLVAIALENKAKRFIYTSTILTYDIFSPQPMTELTPLTGDKSPINYVRTKRLAEIEVEKAIEKGLDAVILHPSVIIGAYDRHTWSKMIMAIEKGTKVIGVPNGSVSWSHAQALAKAHIGAFHKGRRGEHYLMGGPDVSFLEFSQVVPRFLGRPPLRKAQPTWLVKTISIISDALSILTRKEPLLPYDVAQLMTRSVFCSSEKAIKELGYTPSSLDVMIQDCIQWMIKEGLLKRSAPI